VLVLREKAVEAAETELAKPFQRAQCRHAGVAGVSPPLAGESAAASLPIQSDDKREVEAGEKRSSRLCREAREQHLRGAVSWWPSRSPDIPHALGRDGSVRAA
jgi:hypothetical protein